MMKNKKTYHDKFYDITYKQLYQFLIIWIDSSYFDTLLEEPIYKDIHPDASTIERYVWIRSFSKYYMVKAWNEN